MRPAPLLLPFFVAGTAACRNDAKSEAGAETSCAAETHRALASCTGELSDLHAACLDASGTLCAPGDAAVNGALDALSQTVEASCAGTGRFDAAPSAHLDNLEATCAHEATSLVGRVAGGPQAAVWADASEADRRCLATAHAASAEQLRAELDVLEACVDGACDPGTVASDRSALHATLAAEVAAACPDLAGLVAVDAVQLSERVAHQADCLSATADPLGSDRGLTCGPESAAFEAPRGEWTQVVVDGDRWGTLCGDGSDYAFWIRPAPEGSPLDQVLVGLEGGGVCVFEEDCGARQVQAPELFSALDNAEPISVAIASHDPAESPFADWTKVFLPYCNQDVFAGGGVVEDLGSVQLPRYGSVNARAAVSMVRDYVWRELENDPSRPEGYRAEEVRALFGGWSAGSYGTLYNYHWMLDDLGWARTTAFPDAGLALDNGEALGVRALGLVKIPEWGALPQLPPYCFAGDCALGEVMAATLSPRLLEVPEQQLLMLSNQVDDIQAGDAYFSTREGFVNALRRTWCDTRDLPGVAGYLTSTGDTSVHVVTIRPDLWAGSVGGMAMRDWLASAVIDGVEVSSYAEESDVAALVDGVEPFPCALD